MDAQTEILRRLEQCNEQLLKSDSDNKKKESKKVMKRKPNKMPVSPTINISDKNTDNSATCSSVTSDTKKYISKSCRKRNKRKRKILEAAIVLQSKGQDSHSEEQSKLLKKKPVDELTRHTQHHRHTKQNNMELQGLSVDDCDDHKKDSEEKVKENGKENKKLNTDSKMDNEQLSKPKTEPEVVVYQSFRDKIVQQRKQRHEIYKKIRLREQGITQKDLKKGRRKNSGPDTKMMDLLDTDTSKKKWQRFDSVSKGKKKYEKKIEVLDLNKTRLEIRKLVIEGMKNKKDHKSRAERKLEYLISRGAKPMKNKHIDNKKFQEKKKSDMAKQREKNEFDRTMGYKVMKKDRSFKRMNKNDIGLVDGQVGRYRCGVQYVKRKELKGVKKK